MLIMIYMHVFDQLCSMLIQNAMRQAHFLLYLLCEKCCRMTYIIWLPVQWVHQLSYYFVYVISVCCAIAPSPDHAPTPSVPSAPRHVPTRVASGGACCLLRRVPPPLVKILLAISISEKFKGLEPLKNTNSGKAA